MALIALELEAEHTAHDVQAGLVEVVVVPAADGSGRGGDSPGPEDRELERALAQHARRRVRRFELVEADDPDRRRVSHRLPRAASTRARTSGAPGRRPTRAFPRRGPV